MFTHILIPTDGSHLSSSALDRSLGFAREIGARATVLTVIEPFHLFSLAPEQVSDTRDEYRQHAARHAQEILDAAERNARDKHVDCGVLHVTHEHPDQAILTAALNRGCDLIAMASHGRRGITALMLGSVTMKVLAQAKIPVLVYR
ncbi:universal stress protein [Geminicoccus roseus]|uniref:universal stress protein n=1 Tax=Geminicoccus roseus TaxID=404900 RepID=UPI000403771B|nr:universal stress protein [Geminicoccus roseus]